MKATPQIQRDKPKQGLRSLCRLKPEAAVHKICTWWRHQTTVLSHIAVLGLYVDAAVLLKSVGLSITIVSRTKTAEPIEMTFGLWTWVGLCFCVTLSVSCLMNN